MQLPSDVIARMVSWAKEKPEISEMWIFGSRVKGNARADSDIDVAVVLDQQRPESERLAHWIFSHVAWKQELSKLIPYRLDLELGDAEICDDIVGPALVDSGIRIFRKEEVAI